MASKGNAAVAPEPKSPTSQRRFSLGKGNDGEGNPMYKNLQKKRSNSFEASAVYADQSKHSLYEKFKAFIKGTEKP